MRPPPTLAELPPPPAGRSGWPWTVQTQPLSQRTPDGRSWPRISIVTPSYNQGQFIEETIRSVLLQGYPNLDYIIMDGGSTDGAVDVIKAYAPWLSHWASERDRGQSHAINKGLVLAAGEWTNWINSDDFLAPNTLHMLAWESIKAPEADVISLVTEVISEAGEPLYTFVPAKVSGGADFLSRWLMMVPQPSTFVRRDLLRLDENLHYIMDWALYFTLAANGARFRTSPTIGAYFRQHKSSKSDRFNERFDAEKVGFLAAFQAQDKKLARGITTWLRTYEARRELNKRSHSLLALARLACTHPLLLQDRMYWGRLRRILSPIEHAD